MINALPPKLDNPASWLGPDMLSDTEQWLWTLRPDEIKDLERACNAFIDSGKSLKDISKADFLLPIAGVRLEKLHKALIDGIGFGLLRGIDVKKYNREKLATLFMGVGAHLGNARSQNADGHLLGHVRNVYKDKEDVNVRIYQTNSRQTFHTDSCDVVGLFCLQTSKSGGESLLVSAESIYNRMLDGHPDLVKLLFNPVATDKRGEVELGALPYFTIPVFSWHKNKLSVIYQRQYIDSAQRFKSAPRLSAEMVEALDLFDATANDIAINFSMKLQEGDMQFVHNHNMLHDRQGFIDHQDPKKRRHLLRLWLSVEGDRELPAVFKERYGRIDIGDRGGVIVEGTTTQVVLD